MREAPGNPSGNRIGQGAIATQLINGIKASRYSLQGKVARALWAQALQVHEEWPYLDPTNGRRRNIDALAWSTSSLSEGVDASTYLLIECTKSKMPCVFFQDPASQKPDEFPLVASVPQTFDLEGQPGNTFSSQHILGLDALPFVCVPRLSSVFASLVESSTLSGTSSHRTIVDPLTSAAIHLYRALHDRACEHLHPALVLLIAVVDAPMVVVTEPGKEDDPMLTPWVRVRRDKVIGSDNPEFGIDIVHADYFETFIGTVVPPFSIMFGERIRERQSALSTGTVSQEEAAMWQLLEYDEVDSTTDEAETTTDEAEPTSDDSTFRLRSGIDRRTGEDRRSGGDRRSGDGRREEERRVEERRDGERRDDERRDGETRPGRFGRWA